MTKWRLLMIIEQKRRRLNEFVFALILSDSEIVSVSQELDQLLNQYHSLCEKGII
jgi:hypothetical protein